jgi:hypothetical protein
MIVKTSEASGIVLNWLVAKCENLPMKHDPMGFKKDAPNSEQAGWWIWEDEANNLDRTQIIGSKSGYSPSSNWAQGGLIIERELLQVNPKWNNASMEIAGVEGCWTWEAFVLGPENLDDNFEQEGNTSLEAAMRCYVVSKLGNEVEVPDSLAAADSHKTP